MSFSLDRWNLSNIPKIMHCYWGTSRPLSCLRYLTVLSFVHNNPDWKVKVWYPKDSKRIEKSWSARELETTYEYKGKDWFLKLKDIDNVETCEYDFKGSSVENSHDVFKSDFIRWTLLAEQGGLWSDFDIVYTKSINNLLENTFERTSKASAYLCSYTPKRGITGLAVGFMMCEPGNPIFKEAQKISKRDFNDWTNFQMLGKRLLSHALHLTPERFHMNAIDLDESCVYPIMYDRLLNINEGNAWNSSVGCHWYGGSQIMGKYEDRIQDPTTIINDKQSIEKCLRRALSEKI